MPAGDVFGLDGFFLNKSNPITVSAVDINSTDVGAGITVTAGSFSSGTVTLTLSTAAGLTTTPFYTGAKIAVSGVGNGYNGNFVVTGFAGTTTVSYATTGYVGSITTPLTGLTGLALLVTDTAVTNTTWSSAQTHGWFGGGGPSPGFSTVDRIDFSNDTGTANIRSSLTVAREGIAATGNSNYGWFGGGSGNLSLVDRIDFANDSSTASPRGPLSSARQKLAATGNSNYGWFGGGVPGPTLSTVNRIDFSNDSATASVRGPLNTPTGRGYLAATGNTNYGWFGGGLEPGGHVSTVDRIDFSNDSSTASSRGPLSLERSFLAATGNSNYGWFGGGGTPSQVSTVERIDFSNDSSTASVRGPLRLANRQLAATGNSNYGWFGGGGSGNPSIIDRIDFSNDSTTALPRSPLSASRAYSAATSGQARSSSIRLQKTGTYGWFGGGYVSTFSVVVDRIDFSNDSPSALVRGSLNAGRGYLAATGNSNYGWFGGGRTSTPVTVSTVERIDFSNDSVTASTRSPLSLQRAVTAAVSNPNYGWFAGGLFPGASPSSISRIDRIDFSNDTRKDIRNSSLISGVGGAAVGNFNYGWFGAYGVSRLDFSNDVNSLSTRGSLSQGRDFLAATGNYDYGWFGGGIIISARSTRIDRINFSNDSVAASVRSSFIAETDKLAASGNSNYGWFGGGRITDVPTPSIVSTVNRLEFSNDLVQASPRGSLTEERLQLAATSNAPIG